MLVKDFVAILSFSMLREHMKTERFQFFSLICVYSFEDIDFSGILLENMLLYRALC